MIYLPKPRGHSTTGSPEVGDEPRGVARCPWGFINCDERAPLAGSMPRETVNARTFLSTWPRAENRSQIIGIPTRCIYYPSLIMSKTRNLKSKLILRTCKERRMVFNSPGLCITKRVLHSTTRRINYLFV